MAQRFFEGALHASACAKFRPTPPQRLGDRIVAFLRQKYEGPLEQVVDVGCGNGQCLSLFASKFSKLLGTDISEAQITVARGLNYPAHVSFEVSPAETIPLNSGSVQIVNSSQACHWFDLPAFFKEADRVLCSNGIIALSGYTFPYFVHPTKAAELQNHMNVVYEDRTDGFWGPGRADVDNEYINITIPYKQMVRESLWTDEQQMNLAEFASFLTTWSGIQNLRQKKGDLHTQAVLDEFITNCKETLETKEKPENVALVVKRKYFLLMGRKP